MCTVSGTWSTTLYTVHGTQHAPWFFCKKTPVGAINVASNWNIDISNYIFVPVIQNKYVSRCFLKLLIRIILVLFCKLWKLDWLESSRSTNWKKLYASRGLRVVSIDSWGQVRMWYLYFLVDLGLEKSYMRREAWERQDRPPGSRFFRPGHCICGYIAFTANVRFCPILSVLPEMPII